jgi:hypothetical protein
MKSSLERFGVAHKEEICMFRSTIRRAILVSTLALTALIAVAGSAGAQPGLDDDPDYSDPMWIDANPATVVESGIYVDVGFRQGEGVPVIPQPHWADFELSGTR